MNLPKIDFTVLDTETTGLIPRTNRIIEFASVRIEKGLVVDEYEELFAINEDIPPVTKVLTRITDEDLKDKRLITEQKEIILSHIAEDTIIFGQNIRFDIAMLKGEGIDLSNRPMIDTSMIASIVFPELESYSLGYMSQVLHLNHSPVHRALGDVHATLQLIERCYERMQELPEKLLSVVKDITSKSEQAHREFFGTLPNAKRGGNPQWLRDSRKKHETKACKTKSIILPMPNIGVVDIVEEPLEPTFIQNVVNACATCESTVHWIAVKNIESANRRLDIQKSTHILYPPFLLPDPHAIQRLFSQSSFTADEATLAIKLALYQPENRGEIPIHGDERSIWHGKVACTESSEMYMKQFDDLPSTLLIDHRQLLAFLANEDLMSREVFGKNPHIIIDDASMLEDTATKAYSWSCPIESLRAGATDDATLTRFIDVLEFWIERLRAFKDTHIVTKEDLRTPETHGLREQLHGLLAIDTPIRCRSILLDLKRILDPDFFTGRMTWIEQFPGKSPFLQSVPENVSQFLNEHLYDRFPTTLLVPPKSYKTLSQILPPSVPTTLQEGSFGEKNHISISFPKNVSIQSVLKNPPPGKSIVLVSGKNAIEKIFIEHTEVLEKKGVSLFCQGFGGGYDRLQAEFLASSSPALLILSPWRYENVELPNGIVDSLFVTSLPFDSPSNPVFACRAQHYRDSFLEYSLPRLKHRLFRLLRTFLRHKTKSGNVQFLDERIQTKKYGEEVKSFLEYIAGTQIKEGTIAQMNMF